MSAIVGQSLYGSDVGARVGEVSSHTIDEAYRHAVDKVANIRRQIDDLKLQIEEKPTNLVDIDEALTQIDADLGILLCEVEKISSASTLADEIKALHHDAKGLSTRLLCEPFVEVLKEQKKWVSAGFDRALVKTDPEAVHFAVSTNLIYTIAMFQKTEGILAGEKITIHNDDGVALFLVEGEWVPYSAFKEIIRYSQKEARFIGWNFVHPQGFIPRDWAEYDQIYPIAKLTQEAYQKIKTHAQQFWSADQPEVDPGVPKGYILQVMTTGRNLLPDAWWAQNFKEHFPGHGSARLITPEGLVYSFGTKMRLPDQDYLCQVSSYLATGISNVPTPDYEEPRKSDDRLITSLPVTKERFDRIIDFINRANRGICFNFSRQNCVRFIQVVLGIGGINMSIRTTAHELMAGVLPRLSDIPGIGKQVSAVVTKIGCVAASALDAVSTVLGFVTPYHLKKLGEFAVWAATEVLRRIDAVFWNALGLCVLGASKSIVPDSQMSNTSVPEVETFHHVLNWSDFFTPDAMPTYYVTKLKEWMQRQKTALLFRKPEYGFCCFDPDKAALRSPLM